MPLELIIYHGTPYYVHGYIFQVAQDIVLHDNLSSEARIGAIRALLEVCGYTISESVNEDCLDMNDPFYRGCVEAMHHMLRGGSIMELWQQGKYKKEQCYD